MMEAHDTNQPLNQGELEEEKKTVEVSEAITETPTEEVTAEVQPEAAPKPATKEDVLNQLKELAQDAENANKQEIDNLKQSFYKLHNAELEAAKVQFTDNGGNIEDFVAEEDPTEEEFKRLMGVIKEKRSKQVAELERQKKEGVSRKLCAFELVDKGIPRHGYEIADAEGNIIGVVTSGTMSPVLKKGIGMGYVKPEFAKAGTEICIKVRGRNLKAQVVKAPFRK